MYEQAQRHSGYRTTFATLQTIIYPKEMTDFLMQAEFAAESTMKKNSDFNLTVHIYSFQTIGSTELVSADLLI